MKTETKKAMQADCRQLLELAKKLASGPAPRFDAALDCIDAARHLLLQLGGKPTRVIFLPKRIK
jgi:hypothetical protein